MMNKKTISKLVAGSCLSVLSFGALATEGGGLGVYPDGLENFMSGALPPPGVHVLMYGGNAHYDSIRDNKGDKIPVPGFSVNVNVLAPRLIWVTDQKILGGDLAFHTIVPLLDVTAKAAGKKDTSRGLGDVTFGPALGFHPSADLHYVVGLDAYAPTGKYSKTDPSSLGKNYWALQPVWAISYIPPVGVNADLKMMYDFNFRNNDTKTRSGQAFHADYGLGWGFGNGWVAGIGGYAFWQTTDDSGPNSAQGKARAYSIGPSIRYANPQGWLFTAKWEKDFEVRNRPEGSQIYLKASIPF
ncbi:SphA family protein [Providencia rettgeri]|nr:transporter [Providencia rettgeri]